MAATDHLATRRLAPYVPVILRELIAGGRTDLTEVDGSILFADVSGFTALSERLATEGGPPEDWARLVTSLAVLGDTEQAAAVLAEARGAFAGSAEAKALLDEAATTAGIAE